MSQDRKSVKIICFIYLAAAVLYAVLGVMALAGAGSVDASMSVAVDGITLGLQTWAYILGAVLVATAVFYVVYAGAGIRGANNPRKIGQFRTLSIVAVVLAVINMFFAYGNEEMSSLTSPSGFLVYFSVALAVMGIVLAGRIQAATER